MSLMTNYIIILYKLLWTQDFGIKKYFDNKIDIRWLFLN